MDNPLLTFSFLLYLSLIYFLYGDLVLTCYSYSFNFLLQDKDFVAKKDDGGSPINDSGDEEYVASKSRNELIYLDPYLDS